jgi:GNAT superfamily N-acetyltransferase
MPPMDVTIQAVDWDDADAGALRDAQQAELADRYGGYDPDPADEPDDPHPADVVHADQVATMLVLRVDGEAAACGALRDVSATQGSGVGEIKRMYVHPRWRGLGLSRRVLAELEARAGTAGWHRLILETGVRQPESLGLYLSAGYLPIEAFGVWRDSPLSRCFAKDLVAVPRPPVRRSTHRPAVHCADVGWGDPDATRLRRAMWDDLSERYVEETAAAAELGGFPAFDARTGRDVRVFVVATVDGVPAGCGGLRPSGLDERTAEVKKVYVDHAFRGNGVARTVMADLEERARAHGWRRLVLQTGIRNPEAAALYASMGYRPIEPYGRYVDDPISLCFAKDLPAV